MKLFKVIFFQLLFFLIIFSPIWKGVDLLFVTASFLFIYGLISQNVRLIFASAKPFYIIIPLFLYLIINATITYELFDYNNALYLMLKPVRIMITAMGCYVLSVMVKNNFKNGHEGITVIFIFNAIFFHALIMAYESFNPQFRIFLQTFLFEGQDTRGSYNEQFRMGGLMGITGGAILSVVQSTAVLALPFIIKFSRLFICKSIFVLLGLCVFYSILICGRSGIWSIMFFLPISLLFLFKRKGIGFVFWMVTISLVFSYVLFSFINLSMQDIEEGHDIQNMLKRSLDTFIKYDQTGEFKDNTILKLFEMIQFPDGFLPLLFGDASHLFTNTFGRELKSDIGYIRILWSMGLFGMFVYVMPYIKMAKRVYSQNKGIMSSYALIVVFVPLFFHLKEMFLYSRCLFSITVLAYYSTIINNCETTLLKIYKTKSR